MKYKQGAETIVAPFSDHSAVVVRLTYPYQTIPRKIRQWKMNISLLDDSVFRDMLQRFWTKWKVHV